MIIDKDYIESNMGKVMEVKTDKKGNKFYITRITEDGFVGTLIRKGKFNKTEMHFRLPIVVDDNTKISVYAS